MKTSTSLRNATLTVGNKGAGALLITCTWSGLKAWISGTGCQHSDRPAGTEICRHFHTSTHAVLYMCIAVAEQWSLWKRQRLSTTDLVDIQWTAVAGVDMHWSWVQGHVVSNALPAWVCMSIRLLRFSSCQCYMQSSMCRPIPRIRNSISSKLLKTGYAKANKVVCKSAKHCLIQSQNVMLETNIFPWRGFHFRNTSLTAVQLWDFQIFQISGDPESTEFEKNTAKK